MILKIYDHLSCKQRQFFYLKMRTFASLRTLSLKQACLNMSLRQAVNFLEKQNEHLSVETLRELLAIKLKLLHPFNLDQRMDLTTTAQLFSHVRALLAGTSHKYGYTIDEETSNTVLSPYYDLEIGQGIIPMEMPIDGLLPAPNTCCVSVWVGHDDKSPSLFYFSSGGRPNVEAIRRYVAWRIADFLIQSSIHCRDPEWFEIYLGEDEQIVPLTSLEDEETEESAAVICWEKRVLESLSIIDLPFIENEVHQRATGGEWDTLTFIFGGEKPNWVAPFFIYQHIYIDFRGFVIGRV